MRYRNARTGAVLETGCLVSGGDWAAVATAQQPQRPTPPRPAANGTAAGKKPPTHPGKAAGAAKGKEDGVRDAG